METKNIGPRLILNNMNDDEMKAKPINNADIVK